MKLCFFFFYFFDLYGLNANYPYWARSMLLIKKKYLNLMELLKLQRLENMDSVVKLRYFIL